MQIINSEFFQQPANPNGPPGKFVLNDSAIVFFPAGQQHRDIKSHGVSYEDDYKGNAVAGIFQNGRVEIRFHKQYSDERIRHLWSQVCAQAATVPLRAWKVSYQGREIV